MENDRDDERRGEDDVERDDDDRDDGDEKKRLLQLRTEQESVGSELTDLLVCSSGPYIQK
jgi:hypothetical protein